MTLDPLLTLSHRLELEAELVRVLRETQARQVRIAVRCEVAAEVNRA